MSLANIIKPRYNPKVRSNLVQCRLSVEDRIALARMLHTGYESVRVVKRARALQLLDEGLTAPTVAKAVGIGTSTVQRAAHHYAEGGLERAIYEAPRPGAAPIFTKRQEVKIIAMVCAKPPDGFDRWSMSLIVKEAVKRGVVDSISETTVRLMLHQHELKPWRKKNVVRQRGGHRVRSAHGGPARSLRERAESLGAGRMP